jgi:hypothetical protein
VRIFGKILSMTRQKAAVILAVFQGFLTQTAAKDYQKDVRYIL